MFRRQTLDCLPFSTFQWPYLLNTPAGGDGHQAAHKIYCKRTKYSGRYCPITGIWLGIRLRGGSVCVTYYRLFQKMVAGAAFESAAFGYEPKKLPHTLPCYKIVRCLGRMPTSPSKNINECVSFYSEVNTLFQKVSVFHSLSARNRLGYPFTYTASCLYLYLARFPLTCLHPTFWGIGRCSTVMGAPRVHLT